MRRHVKKTRRHLAPKPSTPKTTAPKTERVANVNAGSPAAVTPVGGNATRSTFVVVGLAMAVFLFFAALAVPSRAVRFTTIGRALVHQQTNLVLAGIATLVLTAIVFALTAQ